MYGFSHENMVIGRRLIDLNRVVSVDLFFFLAAGVDARPTAGGGSRYLRVHVPAFRVTLFCKDMTVDYSGFWGWVSLACRVRGSRAGI